MANNGYVLKEWVGDISGNANPAMFRLVGILSQAQTNAPDMRTIEIAKKALRKRILSKELVDMLIKKVLVYSDNRIEIVWLLSGFMDCMPREAASCVVI